jgi:XTP/dITP diphosphohydrolase
LIPEKIKAMSNKLVFATNNQHKLEEILAILGNSFEILSLRDIQCFDEIPEEQDTLEGNAIQKAEYIFNKYKLNCFADDTGLEVEALNSRPGVYSARYSYDELPDIPKELRAEANMQKLLRELDGISNRKAAFRTVICLIENGKKRIFEGKVEGTIIIDPRGAKGFGYDPVFVPNGYTTTFAEMDMEEKNKISHRGLSIDKLCKYLKEL